jgi:hypothetical protein
MARATMGEMGGVRDPLGALALEWTQSLMNRLHGSFFSTQRHGASRRSFQNSAIQTHSVILCASPCLCVEKNFVFSAHISA